jgi:O2-independent ubiquinone biosynthesis protein UbiU
VRAVNYLELVCPAGTPAALRAAIDAGADSVYCGFRDCTNARNYPGLNFDDRELAEGIEYAHARGRWVLVAINTFPRAGDLAPWRRAVDAAAAAGADAVILADIGLLDYAANRHPALRRHLSVQAAASNPLSIDFYCEAFGVSRVVLPRVLAVKEVAALIARMKIEAEVFAFGSLGTMVEGRCYLSSYITGRSPSSDGVCAPAEFVSYREEGGKMVSRLGDVMTNCYAKTENAAYPTPCKSRLTTRGEASYLFEEPVGLNAASILKDLKGAGVTALKIEGRQRSRAYVAEVVAHFRAALDALARGEEAPSSVGDLHAIAEGGKVTLSAYKKGWR